MFSALHKVLPLFSWWLVARKGAGLGVIHREMATLAAYIIGSMLLDAELPVRSVLQHQECSNHKQ